MSGHNIEQKQLKYFKLMDDLKEQILKGDIKAGDKLPSENELSVAYQVSRQTVRKALSILENAGYIFAQHGRGTFCSEMVHRSRNSRNIAVVTTYLSDYIFPRVIDGIDTALARDGYSIILKNTHNSRSREAKCLEELLQKDIEGIIIEPSKSQIYCKHMNLYQKLEDYNIPYVFIQGCFSKMSHKPQVLMDDEKGGYTITRYLLDIGHKNIVGVFKADDMQGQNRHKGYVMALQEVGMMYDPDSVIWFHTEDRKVHPYDAIMQMMNEHKKMDAVVCYNDEIALQVIRALRDAGRKVPEDISVTGYDNSYMAVSDDFRLTTIVHPQEKLGEMAAELLLKILQEGEDAVAEKRIMIEPKLVIGNSCKERR
ncbi:MAG: GntR family transcriptional regulator [Lachnospiraceae bacterium]|nr:GntR family transcriptional regulator [Lachnospiraceae bacterium]